MRTTFAVSVCISTISAIISTASFAGIRCDGTVEGILTRLGVHREAELSTKDTEFKATEYKITERSVGLLAMPSEKPLYDRKTTFTSSGPYTEFRTYLKNNQITGITALTPPGVLKVSHHLSFTMNASCEPDFFFVTGPLWSAALSKEACENQYIQNPTQLPLRANANWKAICERAGGFMVNEHNLCSCKTSPDAASAPGAGPCPYPLAEYVAEMEIAKLPRPQNKPRQFFEYPSQEEALRVKEICTTVFGPVKSASTPTPPRDPKSPAMK